MKTKDFNIMCKESAAYDAAKYIERLEKENAELKKELEEIKKYNELYLKKIRSLAREINELYDEIGELKNEKEALKKFVQKIIAYGANVYAEDVVIKEKILNKK